MADKKQRRKPDSPPLEKVDMTPPERFPRATFPPPGEDTPKPPAAPSPPPPRRNRLSQLLAASFLLLTVAVGVGFVWAVQNPYSSLNPLALATPLPRIITATFLPPTDTPPPTEQPPTEVSPAAVADVGTPAAEPTLGLAVAVDSADSTPTPLGDSEGSPDAAATSYPFVIADDILYTENENERACNWASIAGTVYNLEREPQSGLGIRITNVETTEPITVFSGSSSRFPDGFEYVLNNAPISAAFTVQVVSAAGDVLSDQTMVVTSERCSQNVLVVNFEQVGGY